MTTHVIKRTMLKGNDWDTSKPEFVLKLEHPKVVLLLPMDASVAWAAATPEVCSRYLLFGALLGNHINGVLFDDYGYRVKNHEVLWTDELSITVPDEAE